MLIDLFKKKPYDSELEIVFENTSEDEDLQDQSNDQMQCHYYNMLIKDNMTNQNKRKTSRNKENKS
jgi:hypothetical protein